MKAGSFINMQKADDYKKTNLKTYPQLIKKLIYLSYGTKPDILFVIGQLSKQNIDPYISHFNMTKRVIYYLKGIIYRKIIYSTLL